MGTDETSPPRSLAVACSSEIIFILREKLLLAKRPNLDVTDPNSGYGRAAQYLTKKYSSTQEERDYLYLIWDKHNKEPNSNYQIIDDNLEKDKRNISRQYTLDKLKGRIAERKLQRQEHFEREWSCLVFLGNNAKNSSEPSPKQFHSAGTRILDKIRKLVHLLFEQVTGDDVNLKCLKVSTVPSSSPSRQAISTEKLKLEKEIQCDTFTHGDLDKDGNIIDYKLGDCPCWNWKYSHNHCCFCGSPMFNYDRNLVAYVEDNTMKSDSTAI